MRFTTTFLSIAMWLCCQAEAVPITSNLTDLTIDIKPLHSALLNSSNVSHGSYVVENCGSRQRAVQFMLFDAVAAVGFALQDAYDGDASEHGFRAMFKSDKANKTVISILSHMYTMHGLLGLQPAPQSILRPHFACADASSSKKYEYLKLGYDPWLRCNTAAFQDPPTHAFYAEGTAYIFLCKSFFGLQEKPGFGASRDCPVVGRNRFFGYQDAFHRYQIFSMVNQLNRFYLGDNALDSKSDPKEVFDWNDCVFKFNELESILNPANLELYVAFVRQDCVRFPDPAFGPLTRLELPSTKASRPETA